MPMTQQVLFRPIYLTPMTNLNHQNQQSMILNIANNAHIPNTVSPVRPHPWPNQIFTRRSGIGEVSDPLVQVI